jgi:hypothetical protein
MLISNFSALILAYPNIESQEDAAPAPVQGGFTHTGTGWYIRAFANSLIERETPNGDVMAR